MSTLKSLWLTCFTEKLLLLPYSFLSKEGAIFLMSGRIPQNFIDEVLDRLDIIDVVGSRIDLRKSGKNYSACCPFHDEKTPSFSVSPDKQFYYCFGCGAGGNAISFVIDFDKTTFPEAVENLSRSIGLEMPPEISNSGLCSSFKNSLYDINKDADLFYRSNLRHPKDAREAVGYLKMRGLSGETARNFGIGFALPGWNNILKNLGKDEKKKQHLRDVGLLIDRNEEDKFYDRFRNRIMFPIRDARGRTIGFGGRVLSDEKPKYLNSPETPLFQKGRELYGLYEANQRIRDIENLIVVEGYMDVAVLSENDIHNAVATLGTAVTIEHLNKIFRYTSEVIFCFDGDEAGRKAAGRALETSLPVMTDGRSAKFMFLPEGEDPDSIVQKIGSKKFLELVASAAPLSQFLFESLSSQCDYSTIDGKSKLSKLVVPLINKMPIGAFKTLMIRTLCEKTSLEENELLTLAESEKNNDKFLSDRNKYTGIPDVYFGESSKQTEYQHQDQNKPNYRSAKVTKNHYSIKKSIKVPAVHTLIALLANKPELEKYLPKNEDFLNWEIADSNILSNLTKVIRENPSYTLNHIMGYMRGIGDKKQAENFTNIVAGGLFRPLKNNIGDDEKEFKEILARLLRNSFAKMEPLDLFDYLDSKENIDDHSIKALNRAWLNLSKEQNNEQMRVLYDRIIKKPRIP